MFGMTGPHRSGKTTLAKAAAEAIGVEYLKFSTTDVIRSKGLDCADINDMRQRVMVQRAIVEYCDKVFQNRREPFISDRTPIDVAAYALADVRQHDIEYSKDIEEIVADCIDITNSCFRGVLVLPAALPYVAEPGKAPENAAYQLHHETLVRGLLWDERIENIAFWRLSVECLDHEKRLDTAVEIYEELISQEVSISEIAMKN